MITKRQHQILDILRQSDTWMTYNDMIKRGMLNADDRRIRELVELGLVERKDHPKHRGRYAMFRIKRDRVNLFDMPPDAMLMYSKRGAK
jgi:DNA-binding HxlR family transcriptional regulator